MHTKVLDEKEEIKVLKKLLRSTHNKRTHIRYQVLILHYRSYTNAHIARIMDLNPHTVGNYVNSYKTGGIEALNMGKTTGCPRLLTKEQEEKLYEVITTKTPDEVGFGYRKNWGANIACKWVKDNFQVQYSNRGRLQVLHRLNLSYTRPKYTLAKADTEKQEFEVLKKLD